MGGQASKLRIILCSAAPRIATPPCALTSCTRWSTILHCCTTCLGLHWRKHETKAKETKPNTEEPLSSLVHYTTLHAFTTLHQRYNKTTRLQDY